MTVDPLSSAILQAAPTVILVVNEEGQITQASQEAARTLGFAIGDLVGTPLPHLLQFSLVDLPPKLPVTSQLLRQDGTTLNCEITMLSIDQAGESGQIIFAVPCDHGDAVTQLASRADFERYLDRKIADSDAPVTCFFIDLDHFKQINDNHGHVAGDVALRVVAERLKGCFRPTDFVARYGGDEFVVVVEHCETPAALEAIAERLRRSLSQPIHHDDKLLQASVSIGIASGALSLDLVHAADQAMYAAKRDGRNRWRVRSSLPGDAVYPTK